METTTDNYRAGFGPPEPGIPVIGPIGASVYRNVKEAEAIRNAVDKAFHMGSGCGGGITTPFTPLTHQGVLLTWYVAQVKTAARWDYKYQTKSDIPPGKKRGEYLFDPYGNFNAGAVAAALGLPRLEAVHGADVEHVIDHFHLPDPEDHGDDWIEKGYDWYKKSHVH